MGLLFDIVIPYMESKDKPPDDNAIVVVEPKCKVWIFYTVFFIDLENRS